MPIHPAGLLYLLVVGLFVPMVAVRSAQRLAKLDHPPSRAVLARSAFLSFAFLGVMSWGTAWAIGLPWAHIEPLTGRGVMWAAGALAVLLAWAPLSWRKRPDRDRERLAAVLPETPSQAVLWVALSAGAGFFEEIAWRGVLYANAAYLLGSPWIAAVLCAASFGVAHAYQGPRNVVATTAIALILHALVAVTGSLTAAMLVHFLYDVIVGFLFRELARRDALAARAA